MKKCQDTVSESSFNFGEINQESGNATGKMYSNVLLNANNLIQSGIKETLKNVWKSSKSHSANHATFTCEGMTMRIQEAGDAGGNNPSHGCTPALTALAELRL